MGSLLSLVPETTNDLWPAELADEKAESCLLLFADEWRDDVLSGITATRMTSGFGWGATLEDMLNDLETSEPKLHRFWLLSFAFLCTKRWGESELEIRELRFDFGVGELANLRDAFLPLCLSVCCRFGSLSTTIASTVDVVEIPESRHEFTRFLSSNDGAGTLSASATAMASVSPSLSLAGATGVGMESRDHPIWLAKYSVDGLASTL